jgi:hypothetical protein
MATQRSSRQRKTKAETPEEEMMRLYEPFRFLEKDHWGEILAVYPTGDYVLGTDELAVMDEALEKFGPGCFMFKVGPITMGRLGWRATYS